jgi:hypothetical protein
MTTLIPKYSQGATGAVNRAINLKLAESVSVKDFGAVGNGVANDTAGLVQAYLTLTDIVTGQTSTTGGLTAIGISGTTNMTYKLAGIYSI